MLGGTGEASDDPVGFADMHDGVVGDDIGACAGVKDTVVDEGAQGDFELVAIPVAFLGLREADLPGAKDRLAEAAEQKPTMQLVLECGGGGLVLRLASVDDRERLGQCLGGLLVETLEHLTRQGVHDGGGADVPAGHLPHLVEVRERLAQRHSDALKIDVVGLDDAALPTGELATVDAEDLREPVL